MVSRYAVLGGLVLASLLTFSAVPAQAHADEGLVVKDKRGNAVRLSNGHCVRTKFDGVNREDCNGRREIAIEDRTVYFNFNDSSLTDEAKAKLDSLVEILKSDNEIKSVSIVGYADRIGSVAYNEKLSKKRAMTVKQYLATQGYLNAKITKTRWVGKSKPSVKCAGSKSGEVIACLAPDRKVEVEINYAGEKKAMAATKAKVAAKKKTVKKAAPATAPAAPKN